jgi:hypothetical protein
MILFPQWFFVGLVLGGIALTAIGALILIGLLIRDVARRSIW